MASAQWRVLCAQAAQELAADRRNIARSLAHQAARLAPKQEEPWLLLAAMATPRASPAYLKQALQINPNSSRAKMALKWAEKRIADQRVNQESREAWAGKELALPRLGNALLVGLMALTAAFAAFAALRPPEIDEGLRVAGVVVAHEIDALFATETSTPTPTLTISPTPSLTPLPSLTPTLTPTETPSATQTATIETNPEAIAKFKVEAPSELEGNDRWIDINLTDQTLAVYDGSDLVDSFRVSTGTARTPTVTGEFRIWAKVRIQDMSGPGYYVRDVPWVMYFYKSYGIHGTWWHNNFGTPMSAGCVNMTIEDAEWMYSWGTVGTIVRVHY